MFELVYGGSGSGKSEFAEKEVLSFAGATQKKYYIATMIPFGQDAQQRIERHRNLRAGKGFKTIECPVDLGSCFLPEECCGATVLLECLGNLVANEMFRDEKMNDWESTAKKIQQDLEIFIEKNAVENLVLVSNNIFEDGIEYDLGSRAYMKCLSELNKWVAENSNKVVEVVAGIPLIIKG